MEFERMDEHEKEQWYWAKWRRGSAWIPRWLNCDGDVLTPDGHAPPSDFAVWGPMIPGPPSEQTITEAFEALPARSGLRFAQLRAAIDRGVVK